MADTINMGTMLIEEGAHLPGTFRFESEPWTPFYMAGEIIRELRKGSENKASRAARATSGDDLRALERPEAHRCDTEATSRRDDGGCPNERTATLPDATGYSRIGGRLLLVGSPVF